MLQPQKTHSERQDEHAADEHQQTREQMEVCPPGAGGEGWAAFRHEPKHARHAGIVTDRGRPLVRANDPAADTGKWICPCPPRRSIGGNRDGDRGRHGK